MIAIDGDIVKLMLDSEGHQVVMDIAHDVDIFHFHEVVVVAVDKMGEQ